MSPICPVCQDAACICEDFDPDLARNEQKSDQEIQAKARSSDANSTLLLGALEPHSIPLYAADPWLPAEHP